MSAEPPDGWGFCSRRSCPCWHTDEVACEEFCDVGHPHGRCARCGALEPAHLAQLAEPGKGQP